MMGCSPVSCAKCSPFAVSFVTGGNGMHLIWKTSVSSFCCRKWVSHPGRVCRSFPPVLRRHVLLLSHGPRICVFDFLAVTSCWFPAWSLWRQETQRRCLGDWGQLSQGHGLCSTPPGSLTRALEQPCDQTWPSDTQANPCPCPATPAPGYWSQFCSLERRCGVRTNWMQSFCKLCKETFAPFQV